jgi:branched-chain amino acid transport system permease protein
MALDQILQFLLGGITVGSIYALVALGFALIFNATGIINFAQGQFVMFGGLLTSSILGGFGWPLPAAIVVAIALTAVLGAGIYAVVIYPMRNRPVFTQIMLTLGISIIFETLALMIWGTDPLFLPAFSSDEPIPIGGAMMQPQMLWVLGVALLTMIALQLFYRYTSVGQAMLACSINVTAARAVGIDPRRMVLFAFILAAGLGALGGVLIAPITTTSYSIGLSMTLKGFASAIIGGMGSSLGALVGGLTLGVVESLSAGFLSSGYKDGITLGLLILFLILRPQGIFGER